jgi:hypothetical protein
VKFAARVVMAASPAYVAAFLFVLTTRPRNWQPRRVHTVRDSLVTGARNRRLP